MAEFNITPRKKKQSLVITEVIKYFLDLPMTFYTTVTFYTIDLRKLVSSNAVET